MVMVHEIREQVRAAASVVCVEFSVSGGCDADFVKVASPQSPKLKMGWMLHPDYDRRAASLKLHCSLTDLKHSCAPLRKVSALPAQTSAGWVSDSLGLEQYSDQR